MPYLKDLARVLRAAELPVTEVDGWERRGYPGDGGPAMGAIRGGLVHGTGTPSTVKGDLPTLGILRDGRSDLPGPLSHLAVGRTGRWYVIAGGRCNHAGPVAHSDYSNSHAIGVECEHPNDGTPYPSAQYVSLIAGLAALGKHYGITWRGHKEEAVPLGRKPDPTLDMGKLRGDVKRAQGPAKPQPAPEPAGRPPAEDSPHSYVIRPGDTLSAIAARYRTSVGALAVLNGIADVNRIRAGQRIYLRWNVKRGQTLSEIARTVGSSVAAIARANGIDNPDVIAAGSWLRIP